MADGGKTQNAKPQKAVCWHEYDQDGRVKIVIGTPLELRTCRQQVEKLDWKKANIHIKILDYERNHLSYPMMNLTFIDADGDSVTYQLKYVSGIYILSGGSAPREGTMIIEGTPYLADNPDQQKLVVKGSKKFVHPRKELISFNLKQGVLEDKITAINQGEAVKKFSERGKKNLGGGLDFKVFSIEGGGERERGSEEENKSGGSRQREYTLRIATSELIFE